MSSHFHDGIAKGCNLPADLRWSALTRRQMSLSDTYLAISRFIRVHQNLGFKSWYILVLPGCIENLDWWASSRIYLRSSRSLGTTSLFLHQTTPSLSCL